MPETTRRHYKNVKCSLRRILLHPEETAPLVEQRCLAVSQMAVRASHLCGVMVHELLKREEEEEGKNEGPAIEWPDFNKLNVFVQLFTRGSRAVAKTRKPTPAIEWAWNNWFRDVVTKTPPTSRYHSDYNLIAYCAKTFQTCFLNNLQLNFVSRQRRAIRTYCSQSPDAEKKSSKVPNTFVYALQALMNGWKYIGRTYSPTELEELRDAHSDFIERHRRHLPPRGSISSPVDHLRYYNFLRREYGGNESTKLKNIPLVPQNVIKMHYVDFDALGVKGLCHDSDIKVKKK